jgi:hypothetical protein
MLFADRPGCGPRDGKGFQACLSSQPLGIKGSAASKIAGKVAFWKGVKVVA